MTLSQHTRGVCCVAASADGRTAVSVGDDGLLFVHDLDAMATVATVRVPNPVRAAAFLTPGSLSLLFSNQLLLVVELDGFREVASFRGAFGCMSLHAASGRIITGSLEPEVLIFDKPSLASPPRRIRMPSPVRALAQDGRGGDFVSITSKGEVSLHAPDGGITTSVASESGALDVDAQVVALPSGYGTIVADFSDAPQRLVTFELKLWDQSLREVRRETMPLADQRAVAPDSDGMLVAASGELVLLTRRGRRSLLPLAGHAVSHLVRLGESEKRLLLARTDGSLTVVSP